MLYLMQIFMTLLSAKWPTSAERYLAMSADAHDFEVRAQALERRRA